MLVLSGERISELDRLSVCGAGDEFLISRHYNLSSDRLFSRRLKYETLVDDAISNLCGALYLSSGAFVEKFDYSRKNHGHDYSTVYVYARPLSAISAASGVTVYPKQVLPIAEMGAINCGQLCSVIMYGPGQQYNRIEDIPIIGELKFMAYSQLSSIDIDSIDFDGWVYPDGSEYKADDFPEAYAIYGDGQSSTFKVPFLSNFIKLNPGIEKQEPIKKFLAVNQAIIAHTHGIPKQMAQGQSGKVAVNIKVPATSTCPEEMYTQQLQLIETIHLGGKAHKQVESSEYRIENIAQSGLTMSGGTCSTEEKDIETTPTYNLLPVLIYIGQKAK